MRTIEANAISEAVEKLFIDACCNINNDVKNKIKEQVISEKSDYGKDILHQILQNFEIAHNESIPICQDTGMSVVFLEIGQDVHINGGYIYDAINKGVKNAYINGYLRKSVVRSPLNRENTKDNTPAIIHTEIVQGENIKITAVPKGFGSENMSALKMLKPSDGIEGIKKFVLDTVISAGSNPCPPIVVGIGIGGTFEKCALLAKKALLRELGGEHIDPFYAKLEKELLDTINKTGIGPQGLGGTTTCIGVNILDYPTHIAGMPVAVNIQCHVSRHKEIIL